MFNRLMTLAAATVKAFRVSADEEGTEPKDVVNEQFAEGNLPLERYEELRLALALREAA